MRQRKWPNAGSGPDLTCGLEGPPPEDQLGRSGILYPARRANTSALVRSLRRTASDRECPLIVAAPGPFVAHSSPVPRRCEQLLRSMFHAAGQPAHA